MNTALTVTDPLVEAEVSIVITLTPDKRPRDERPALVSVGVAGQVPIIKSGVFGATMELIEEAWMAFGVRAQLAAVAAADEASAMTATATTVEEVVAETAVAEETVTETAVVSENTTAASSPQRPTAKPTVPKPTTSNLSLF